MDESLQHLIMIMIIKNNESSYTFFLKSTSSSVVILGITFPVELAELSTVDYPLEEI